MTEPRTVYLAACMKCAPFLPMPFYDRAERDEWASAHSDAARHPVIVTTQEETR